MGNSLLKGISMSIDCMSFVSEKLRLSCFIAIFHSHSDNASFEFVVRYTTDELHGASTWAALDPAQGKFEFTDLHITGGSHLAFEDGKNQDTAFATDIGTVYGDKTGTGSYGTSKQSCF